MTKDLQPELGSGALREALEQRIKECRETAERWETESRNVRIDRAIHKDYSLALHALANLLERALSLSSPIEPERCPTCTSSVRNIKAGLAYGVLEPGKCPNIWHDEAQASSEIREAQLNEADVVNVLVEMSDGVYWKEPDADGHVSRFTARLNALLAPSRQGAGGK